ncbi:MAG: phenylalanine--tRNA ligase subunit beta [Candidatus Omnitrophota bacterium]
MKVTYNWLKDFVDIKLEPQELAAKLTMAGLEVTASEKLGSGDTIFEIEVTPNRADCLSVLGIAREVAAITNKKLKWSPGPPPGYARDSLRSQVTRSPGKKPEDKLFSIKMEGLKDCPLYTGRLIKGVLVGPSPDWLKTRLEAVGLRPINNIVDITNYCLMELGQPMHAFDYDKILKRSTAEIIVRRAGKGEKIIAIDGIERQLSPDDLVIADRVGPIALAGIMGGLDTEVDSATKNILLESAYFNPIIIRRGSRALGLASESSYRFERGVDLPMVIAASDKAVALIQELCGGRLVCDEAKGKKIDKKEPKITLGFSQVNKILGTELKAAQIKTILKNLGFGISTKTKDSISVSTPSFRRDVRAAVDLVEEISRIFGYDKIKASLPYIRALHILNSPNFLRQEQAVIRETLAGLGLNEIISYSLISRDLLFKLNLQDPDAIQIKNPLSKDQEVMRPTLIAGLLQCVARNVSNRMDTIKAFECGPVYLRGTQGAYPNEQPSLGIVIFGQAGDNWLRESGELTFFDLKGLIEALFSRLGIKEYSFIACDCPYLAPDRAAVIKIKDKALGCMGEVKGQVLANYDIKRKGVFIAEISIEALSKFIQPKQNYAAYSNYPSIKRDLSIVAKYALAQHEVVKIIREEGPGYITCVKLIDQYIGNQIPKGSRGLTFQIEYQLAARTLTDEEVDTIHQKIIARLVNALGVKIR